MRIAIWGNGTFGKYVFKQIKNNNANSIVCIIDKNAVERGEADLKVVTPDVFVEEYSNVTDCILVAFMDGITVREQLARMNVNKWGIIENRVLLWHLRLSEDLERDRDILWNYNKEIEFPIMQTLETNVVDYCNLNCKGCSHFSNIFEKGAQIPFEVFERDIKFLSNKIYIKQFNLLGGEALLSDRIEDYFQCLTEYMHKTHIVLVTNGLLIPSLSNKILNSLMKYNVLVSITVYPPVEKIRHKITETLEKYGINYEFREKVADFGKNIDLSGENDPMKAQEMCRESTCQFLRDGKIYKCPFSALGNYYFDYYKIPLNFEEGIDIFDARTDWERVIERLREYPIEQCKYCGLEERFEWTVSRHPQKEEWLIDGTKADRVEN